MLAATPSQLHILDDLVRGQKMWGASVSITERGCMFTSDEFVDEELRIPPGIQSQIFITTRGEVEGTVGIGPKTVTVKPHAFATIDVLIDGPGDFTWTCNGKPRKLVVESADQIRATREAMAARNAPAPLELGAQLYQRKGCVSCHTVDGSPRVGPTWKGIWGTTVTGRDGTTRHVDEEYLRESIKSAQAFVVAGYPPTMPSFEGQLRPRELDALVVYIKSLE